MTSRVIQGDSAEIMAALIASGEEFDLILTDPPYNLNKDFGNDSDSRPLDEFLSWARGRIDQCRDLLSDDGSLLWFGIHHYIGYLQVAMYESGLKYRRMNIWHYKNGFSRSKKAPGNEYEPFLWFSKSDKKWTYNVDDVRIPYKSTDRLKNPVWYKTASGERKQWIPNSRGAMRGDIWEFPTLAGKRFADERTEHPTQKPESLFTELVRAYCPKASDGMLEGKVLDPFLGSGTTAAVCERLNQEGHRITYVGIELEQRWTEVALKRIAEIQTTPQLPLV